MTSESLEEMPEEVMEYFCERVLKRDWPNSIHVYYFIKNSFKWQRENSASRYKLYYIPNDIENGIFIGILSRPEKGFPDVIVTYTSPGNEEQFQRILHTNECVNWQKKLLFRAIPFRMRRIIESTIEDKGLKVSMYIDTMLKWMPADKAVKLNYEVPDDIFIDKLSVDHIDFIYAQWVLRDFYPRSDIYDSVKLNISLGVFNRQNGELLAWAMCGSNGGVSTLMVQSNCRGSGFGKLILSAITKALGDADVSPHGLILATNNVSLSLFNNVGYLKQSLPLSDFIIEDPSISTP